MELQSVFVREKLSFIPINKRVILGLFSLLCLCLDLSSVTFSLSGVAKAKENSAQSQQIISESIETNDFEDFEKRALELAGTLGPENILVAYDIDSTLLSTNQILGGDIWYKWQSGEMKKPQPNDAITTDLSKFAQINRKLLAITGMHPPQPEIPVIVRKIQDRGIPSIIVTARRYDLRDASQAALSANGIDASRQAIGQSQGYPGTYFPFDVDSPEKDGLTAELVKKLALPSPRIVSYQNGILMADGVHKGATLRSLLHKMGRSFKVILFIDDAQHNVQAVQAAFLDTNTSVITFRYGREDQKSKDFFETDKTEIKEIWKKYENIMTQLFPGAA